MDFWVTQRHVRYSSMNSKINFFLSVLDMTEKTSNLCLICYWIAILLPNQLPCLCVQGQGHVEGLASKGSLKSKKLGDAKKVEKVEWLENPYFPQRRWNGKCRFDVRRFLLAGFYLASNQYKNSECRCRESNFTRPWRKESVLETPLIKQSNMIQIALPRAKRQVGRQYSMLNCSNLLLHHFNNSV